jgi:ABC-type transporter Mla subunit MlaD
MNSGLYDPAALVAKTEHFFFGTPSSIVFNALIFGIFLIGLLIIIVGWLRIRLESHHLAKTRRIFQEAIPGRLQELSERLVQTGISHKSRVMQAIEAVRDVRQRQGNVETLGDALRTIYLTKSTWSRYLASILIIFGLMGTIIGLSMAIVNLRGMLMSMGGDVTSSDFDKIIKEILGSLGFMETAFSTTLCGFFFYLGLSFIDQAYQYAREGFANNFESFVSNLLIPFFTPDQGVDDFMELASIMKTSTASLNQTTENLGNLLEQVGGNQEIYGEIANSQRDALFDLRHQQSDMAGYYKRFAEAFENLEQLTRAQSDERRQTQDTIKDLFQTFGGDRAEIEKLYANLAVSLKELRTSFQQSMVETAANLKVAQDLQTQEIKRLEKDHDAVLRVATTKMTDLAGSSQAIFAEMDGKTKLSVRQYADEMKQMMAQVVRDANIQLTDQKKRYDAKLEHVTDAVAAAATQIASFENRFLDKLEVSFEKVTKDMPALNESLAENFAQGTQTLFDRVDDSLKKISRHYDQSAGMSDKLNDTLQNLSKTQQSLSDNLKEIFWFKTEKEALLSSQEIFKLEYVYIRNKFRWLGRLLGMKVQ